MSEAIEQLQRARNEVENYKQTVKALLAFSAFVVHDGHEQRSGANFGFGRRMTTSEDNERTPSNSVTPDLVAQKSMDYGIAAEVKKSLPQNQERWDRCLHQMLKYDDDLTGWWTSDGKIPIADAVLLLHHSRSRPFCRFLQETQSKDPKSVGKNTSVVEFGSSEETASYYFFRLEHGVIRDDELLHKLNNGIQIPMGKILESFPNVLFYDSPPPVAFLLTHLWMDMFPSMINDAEYDEKYKAIRFPVSVRKVTDELQQAYGSATLSNDQRSVEFPAHKWIKDAFEKLVEFKLALPPSDGDDTYQILFKALRGDILVRFIKLELGQREDESQTTDDQTHQLPLFPGVEDEE